MWLYCIRPQDHGLLIVRFCLLSLFGDEFQLVLPEFDDIAIFQEMLLDRLPIDQRTVGAIQIFQKRIIVTTAACSPLIARLSI